MSNRREKPGLVWMRKRWPLAHLARIETYAAAGFPDVVGAIGDWRGYIELKSGVLMQDGKTLRLLKKLRPEQAAFCTEAAQRGMNVLYACWIADERSLYFSTQSPTVTREWAKGHITYAPVTSEFIIGRLDEAYRRWWK